MLARSEVIISYEPRGAVRQAFTNHDPELVISGPAGTGKSRGCLELLHLRMSKYPGARGLMVRRTRKSLTQSAMVTFDKEVRHPLDGVHFHSTKQEYQYPNGSVIVVTGLDDPGDALSAQYDMVYAQQAEELSENSWETVTTRLRNGAIPHPQVLGDVNPEAPNHWLKLRADRGACTMLESRHQDNPVLWQDGEWTAEGRRYVLGVLGNLTGVRRLRLLDGKWVSAEGQVYEAFDKAVHLIDSFEIPASWRRIRCTDFGFTNPFVTQWWAIDPDSRMYLYRELYETQKLVSDEAGDINDLSQGERTEATIADHDAEDRATLHRHGIPTRPAFKAIRLGIEGVQERLRKAGDGKPRLFLFRDALVRRDEALVAAKKPTCTADEFDSYVYPKGQDGKPLKEEPVKVDDHGMDATRYAVAYIDNLSEKPAITGNRVAVSGPRPQIPQYTGSRYRG